MARGDVLLVNLPPSDQGLPDSPSPESWPTHHGLLLLGAAAAHETCNAAHTFN